MGKRRVFWGKVTAYALTAALLAGTAVSAAELPDAAEEYEIEAVVEDGDASYAEPEAAAFEEEPAAEELLTEEEPEIAPDDAAEDAGDEAVFDVVAEEDLNAPVETAEEEAELPEAVEEEEVLVGAATPIADTSVTWEVIDDTLMLDGTGDVPDYASADAAPWYADAAVIKKISFGSGITGAGAYAFYGLANVQEVQIPATVEHITLNAFNKETLKNIIGAFGTGAMVYAKEEGIHFKPDTDTDLALAEMTVHPAAYSYNGSPCVPEVTVEYYGVTLVKDTDYTLAYNNNTNAGTATATVTAVTGSGFINKKTVTYTITPVTFTSVVVSGIVNKAYNGSAQTQNLTLKYGAVTLVPNTDYTVAYSNNVNAGTATITLTGKGNYQGTQTKTFVIDALPLVANGVTGVKNKVYSGTVTQNPTVKVNGVTLKKDIDYTLTYEKNTKVGTAKVKVNGKGNYKGTVTKSFKITKASVKKASVKNVKTKVYTGKKITQKPVVKVGGRTLKKGKDYTITYVNNRNIGTAKMTIKGKGNYKGSITKKFKIRKASIADADIGEIDDRTFTGKEIEPSPSVRIGKKKLKEGTDYTLSYDDNLNVGQATVRIKGKGNYKGSETTTFRINKAEMKNTKVTGIKNKGYTGKAVKQDPDVTLNGVKLKENRDYELSYENNVEVGTATIYITGKGNMTGKLKANFQIKMMSLADAKISEIDDQTYTGGAITPSVKVTYNGDTLKQGTDYSVSYDDNVNIGTATVTLTGKGSYSGQRRVSFKILPKGTRFKSTQRTGNKVALTWTPLEEDSDGYQIQYSTSSNFPSDSSKTLQMMRGENSKYTLSLPSSSNYYVRIRSFIKNGGSMIYSKWSSAVSV